MRFEPITSNQPDGCATNCTTGTALVGGKMVDLIIGDIFAAMCIAVMLTYTRAVTSLYCTSCQCSLSNIGGYTRQNGRYLLLEWEAAATVHSVPLTVANTTTWHYTSSDSHLYPILITSVHSLYSHWPQLVAIALRCILCRLFRIYCVTSKCNRKHQHLQALGGSSLTLNHEPSNLVWTWTSHTICFVF